MDTTASATDDVRVVKTLGTTTSPDAAPPAVRVARPGWRDPRLWLGVVIVAACVVAGARILGSSDDTVSVWAVSGDHAAGATLDPSDLVEKKVRFADAAELDDYYSADADLPDHAVFVRAVGAGELLPRAAVGSEDGSDLMQVPLTVDPGGVPPGVRSGSVVNVFVSGQPNGGQQAPDPGKPVLSHADVVAFVSSADTLDSSGQAQLTVAVKEDDVRAYFSAVAALDSPVITVVRVS